jgi:hypothetical protein
MMKNLDDLVPGETVVYFTGLTLAGSHNEISRTAWDMYLRGDADLTQSRRIDGKFDYLVTRRREKPSVRSMAVRNSYYNHLENGNVAIEKARARK